jgi:hypothetical protein
MKNVLQQLVKANQVRTGDNCVKISFDKGPIDKRSHNQTAIQLQVTKSDNHLWKSKGRARFGQLNTGNEKVL